jgi:hypothetical protein
LQYSASTPSCQCHDLGACAVTDMGCRSWTRRPSTGCRMDENFRACWPARCLLLRAAPYCPSTTSIFVLHWACALGMCLVLRSRAAGFETEKGKKKKIMPDRYGPADGRTIRRKTARLGRNGPAGIPNPNNRTMHHRDSTGGKRLEHEARNAVFGPRPNVIGGRTMKTSQERPVGKTIKPDGEWEPTANGGLENSVT